MIAALRALWFLAHVAGIGVVTIGVMGLCGPRRLHWLYDPWWWVVVIVLNVSTITTLAGSGRWVAAGVFVGVTVAALWYLREAIAIHRVRRVLGQVLR